MKNLFTFLFVLLFIIPCVFPAHAQLSFLDLSFGTGGLVITSPPGAVIYDGGSFSAVAIQPDNKIIATGSAIEHVFIARYNENGTLDSTFAVNGIFMGGPTYSGANALILQPDGKIVIAGYEASPTLDDDFLIMRLNTDGSLDNTFGSAGMVTIRYSAGNDWAYALALQPDNKIVITGNVNETYISMARLLPDGELDSAFGADGLIVTPYPGQPNGIAVMPDGRIVIGCEAAPVAFMAIRCLANGIPDTSFNHTGVVVSYAGDGGFNYCHAMQLQPDGKVALAGAGSFGAGGSDFTLIRYNMDGTLDRSFGDTGVVNIDFNDSDDEATALYLAADGKLIIAGGSGARFGLACIYGNGGIDSNFGNYGRITTTIQDGDDIPKGVTVQQDGKIVLAGWSYNNIMLGDDPTLARYINSAVAVPQMINNQYNIILYPNPAAGILNIKGNMSHVISVTVCDVQGNPIPINTDWVNHKVYINSIADGLYFFKISYNDHPPDVQKIIIQN